MGPAILATLFDGLYAQRGLAMIQSLREHSHFRLFVLALDEQAEQATAKLDDPRIVVTPLRQTVTRDVLDILEQRSKAEQAWTLASYWTNFVMESFEPPHLTYVDADTFFFAPLDGFYQEVGFADVSIVPHRFPEELKDREHKNGIFNVNFVYFKNSPQGRGVLSEWTRQCLEWCYARTERDAEGHLLFGDQGYLDAWPDFPDMYVHVLMNNGVNLAPWNQMRYRYTMEENVYVIEPRPRSDETGSEYAVERIDRLIAYHFHGWRGQQWRSGYALRKNVIDLIYRKYERAMEKIERG